MSRVKKYQLLIVMSLLSCFQLSAQDPAFIPVTDSILATPPDSLVMVGDILISGNRKTKEKIILRELPFHTGETYPLDVLVKKFDQARRQLMNTALFNHVVVAARTLGGTRIDVVVELKERWYLFPLPYFRPVDRNLNQWLFEKDASLSRVNYGVKFNYNNATGRNDKFKLSLINGYTKQVSISYDRPYIDKDLKWGLKFSFGSGKNREINYNTIDDKQVFLKDENNFVRSFANANMELNYRKAIKTKHSLGIGYVSESVSDTIIALNAMFFSSGRNSVRYPSIYYNLSYINLDFNPYPTKGYAAQLYAGKSGLNSIINIWQLHVKGLGVWPLLPKLYYNLSVYGGIKLPFRQPYFSRRFLGYGDVFMQGYEYFVVDGTAGGFAKTSLTKEFFNFSVHTPSYKKGKKEHIPVRIFGKVFGNTGYVYNPQPGENSLSNKMLYSGGLGIDILLFYDVTIKLEWSFNSIGQNGLFLHRKTIF